MMSPDEIEKYQKENLLLKEQIEERTGKTVKRKKSQRRYRTKRAGPGTLLSSHRHSNSLWNS